jgi:hypothetical protein
MKPRHTSRQVLALLDAQLERFKIIVGALDESGALDVLDELFDKTNARLKDASHAERRRMVRVLADAAAQRLLQHGVERELVGSIERIVVKNWMRLLLSTTKTERLSVVLRRAVDDWARELENESARSDKATEATRSQWLGALRVAAGCGAVVLDSANMMTISPVPGYLFASVMGGAVMLVGGVEDIWKSKS